MDEGTHDLAGRPWAKLSELHAGSVIELDDGFACCNGQTRTVYKDHHEDHLYFYCNEGHHYLHQNQAGCVVGVYRKETK